MIDRESPCHAPPHAESILGPILRVPHPLAGWVGAAKEVLRPQKRRNHRRMNNRLNNYNQRRVVLEVKIKLLKLLVLVLQLLHL